MFDLTGKKALVTGSTQGIGFAVAKALAERGAKVYVHGGTSLEKSRLASERIPNSEYLAVNLEETDAADKIYKKTGDVDILWQTLLFSSERYGRMFHTTNSKSR